MNTLGLGDLSRVLNLGGGLTGKGAAHIQLLVSGKGAALIQLIVSGKGAALIQLIL